MSTNYEFTCPHCGTQITAQAEWVGMEAECPHCGKSVVIPEAPKTTIPPPSFAVPGMGKTFSSAIKHAVPPPPPLSSLPPPPPPPPPHEPETASSDKEGEKKPITSKFSFKKFFFQDYPWGRLYICFARILACLVLLLGIIVALDAIITPFIQRSNRLKNQENRARELVEQQKKFHKSYIRVASLVLTGNSGKVRFNFPADLLQVNAEFDESLMTCRETEDSLEALEEYQKKITAISESMRAYFEKYSENVMKQLRKGDAIRVNLKTNRNSKRNSTISLQLGQNADFYEDDPAELLKNLQEWINKLQQMTDDHQLRTSTDLQNLAAGLMFISQSLNAHKMRKTVGSGNYSNEPQTRQVTAGRDQYAQEKELLLAILQVIVVRLCNPACNQRDIFVWTISNECQQLRNNLTAHQNILQQITEDFKSELKAGCERALGCFLVSMFLAFMMLVGADFLRAHFDMAIHARDLLQKTHILLFTVLGALFLLSGCGKTPQELLERDKAELQKEAIAQIIRRNINDPENKEASCYVSNGNELVMISGGNPEIALEDRTIGFQQLCIAKAGRQYSVLKLSFLSVEAKVGQFRKTKKGECKAQLTLTYTRNNSKGEDILFWGLCVHTLLPERPTSQKALRNELLKQLPPENCDHAIAAAAAEAGEQDKAVEAIEILWDKEQKKWVLAEKDTEVPFTPVPQINDAEIDNAVGSVHFKRFTGKQNGNTYTLFLNDRNFDTATQLNAGMLKNDKGEWKEASIVLQTRALRKEISSWRSRSQYNLNDLTNFVREIGKYPRAENYSEAIKIAENAGHHYCDSFKAVSKENRDLLARALACFQKESCYKILNADELRDHCQKNLDAVNAELQRRTDAAQADYEKRLRLLAESREDVIRLVNEKNIRLLGEKLQQNPLLQNNRKIEHHISTLYFLVETLKKNKKMLELLIRHSWKCEEYSLLSPCTMCGGSGLHDCKLCKNTGVCTLCGGGGSKTVSVKTHEGVETRTVRCNPKCSLCQGHTKKCKKCWGKRGTLDKEAAQNAVDKECRKLLELIAEITKAQKVGEIKEDSTPSAEKTEDSLSKFRKAAEQ